MEKEDILEKLSFIKSSLKKLKIRYEKYIKEENEFDKETLYFAMEKMAEETIETAIKVNNILLEEKDEYAPSYYDSFAYLEKHYSIDKKLIQSISQTAGFRNRLAHEYMQLNPKVVERSVQNILILYEKYIHMIQKIIKD